MTTTLRATLDICRALKGASGIKVNRHFDGFFADRLIQAFAQPSLIDAVEHLAKSLDASVEFVGGARTAAFLQAAHASDALSVLVWLRAHARIAALICGLRDGDDYEAAINSIVIDEAAVADESVMDGRRVFDFPLLVRTRAPLAHGADQKAGNATLFRRRQVVTETGRLLTLPYYGANAIRGQLRDRLADYTLSRLGLTPSRGRPPVALWFFYILYSGGALQEKGLANQDQNGLAKGIGNGDSLKTDGIRHFRDFLPGVSLLGAAVGNRILPGRLYAGDLRPRCREWGTGEVASAELFSWEFLTRRDDYEGHGEDDENRSMIATTEVLREGTILDGGFDIDFHANELERSALGRGLLILAQMGRIGADNRRGFGKCQIELPESLPDPQPFDEFLDTRKAEILEYLRAVGALLPDGMAAPVAVEPVAKQKPKPARKAPAAKPTEPDPDPDPFFDDIDALTIDTSV